jgi:uncharacterized protein (DUF58 family)
MQAAPSSGLIDPAVLARLGDLELVARTVVEGFMHGLHRAPRLGHSTDFAEHRPYQPGDDIRRIDWRVYGRTDRFYVKEFEADTNAAVVLALDVSRSMDFGTGGVTKFHYARMLAAALAWFSQRQGDRVGVVLYADRIVEYVPPSTRHLSLVLHTLDRARPAGVAGGTEAVAAISELLTRTGITTFVSDWYAEPALVKQSLGSIRARGHDVIAFHILDPAERAFRFDAAASFEDLETEERLPVVPDQLRQRYLALYEDHLANLARELARTGIDYLRVETAKPLDLALHEYLARREAMARVR